MWQRDICDDQAVSTEKNKYIQQKEKKTSLMRQQKNPMTKFMVSYGKREPLILQDTKCSQSSVRHFIGCAHQSGESVM